MGTEDMVGLECQVCTWCNMSSGNHRGDGGLVLICSGCPDAGGYESGSEHWMDLRRSHEVALIEREAAGVPTLFVF